MAQKITYTINKIPGFRYEVTLPTGLSRIMDDKGKADIYVNNQWKTWDNLYYKKENVIENLDIFFKFLNSNISIFKYKYDYLVQLNKTQLAKSFFELLGGAVLDYSKFSGPISHWSVYFKKNYDNGKYAEFKLIPSFSYRNGNEYICDFFYSYVSTCYGLPNETKRISSEEGQGLIALLFLSILSMISEGEFASNIRCINGHRAYRSDLLEYAKSKGFI